MFYLFWRVGGTTFQGVVVISYYRLIFLVEGTNAGE